MARQSSSSSQQQQRPAASAATPPPKTVRTRYLTLYNLASAALWLQVFWRVVLVVTVGGGWEGVFASSDALVRWVQTAAVLEVVHAATGKSQLGLFFGSLPGGFTIVISGELELTTYLYSRRRPRSPPHHPDASCIPLPPRLGHCLLLP